MRKFLKCLNDSCEFIELGDHEHLSVGGSFERISVFHKLETHFICQNILLSRSNDGKIKKIIHISAQEIPIPPDDNNLQG